MREKPGNSKDKGQYSMLIVCLTVFFGTLLAVWLWAVKRNSFRAKSFPFPYVDNRDILEIVISAILVTVFVYLLPGEKIKGR